jgi:hypothetical protein
VEGLLTAPLLTESASRYYDHFGRGLEVKPLAKHLMPASMDLANIRRKVANSLRLQGDSTSFLIIAA